MVESDRVCMFWIILSNMGQKHVDPGEASNLELTIELMS